MVVLFLICGTTSFTTRIFNTVLPTYRNQKKESNKTIVKKFMPNSKSPWFTSHSKWKNLYVLIVGKCLNFNLSGIRVTYTGLISFIGGILSIAQLISNFANKVTIITFVEKNKDNINFIKKNLNKNINFKFLTKKDSPTITKTRIIDNYSKRNLLGLYKFNNNSISKIEENNFLKLIKKEEKKNNQILFSDFGHGIITKKIANKFSNISNFTSLNVQLNSSNQNSLGIFKYKKAKVLIINIGELKREIRDNDLDVLSLGKKLKKKLDCNLLIVTMGSAGSYLVNFKNNKSTFCPAFAKKIIDRVGAGDVMHSIVSMCLKNKVEADLSLFISSLAAAYSVENIGNSNILDKKILLRSIKYLIK